LAYFYVGDGEVTPPVEIAHGVPPGAAKIAPTTPVITDSDGDGTPDEREIALGTDPGDPNDKPLDSDGDGMDDGWEEDNGLDPNDDTDGDLDDDNDGLTNIQEYQQNTSPTNPDTDGDRILDGDEVKSGTDPLVLQTTPRSTPSSTPQSTTQPTIPSTPSSKPQLTLSSVPLGESPLIRIQTTSYIYANGQLIAKLVN